MRAGLRCAASASGGLELLATEPLTCEALIALLDSWVGREVAVRVVSADQELLAVWHAELCERSTAKRPASFWALRPRGAGQERHAERPGIYLHPHRLQEARLHGDPTVLDFTQDGVRLALRLL